MKAHPQHDLAGLEAFLQMVYPLEDIYTTLHQWYEIYQTALYPKEREDVFQAIRALGMALDRLHHRT